MKSHDEGVTLFRGTRWRGAVRVGTDRAEKLFPLDQKDAAVAWVKDTRAALHQQRRETGDAPIPRRGERRAVPLAAVSTLDADVARFLPTIAARASFKSDRSHLRAWLAAIVNGVRLGTKTRATLTVEDRQLAIEHWKTAPSAHLVRRVRVAAHERDGRTLPAYERTAPATSGRAVAARTIRHRDRMLHELFTYLETPLPPLRKGAVPAAPEPYPTGVPATVIVTVARNLARAAAPRQLVKRYATPAATEAAIAREAIRQQDRQRTYARYLVLVTTGQRPCQVMRAEPNDVSLDACAWTVRSAKGGRPHTIELTADMVQAWDAFIAADAWGPFDSSTYGNRVHAAGWPAGTRPYNARHSVAIDMLARDPSAMHKVQDQLGHRRLSTAERFYAARVPDRTAALLEGRLTDAFKLRGVK